MILIQADNLDDMLAQRSWANFCRDLHAAAVDCGNIVFSGGTPMLCVTQRYFIMVDVAEDMHNYLKGRATDIGDEYGMTAAIKLGEGVFDGE